VPQLLVIEDDPRLREAMIRSLRASGHAVASAATGMGGLQEALEHRPDLVILDLGLPDVDGAELLRILRAVSDVPVIVATARDDDASAVRALDSGADDYVVKPFSAAQLEARVRAILRRGTGAAAEDPLTVGPLVIDQAAREVRLDGARIDLSPKEFDLLAYLAARPGQVVTKRALLAVVWQTQFGGADKTVDVHLSWLRRKLGESAQAPRLLHTVRGVGVKLVDPDA
jgi:DNA-binding response OmpR family regulator